MSTGRALYMLNACTKEDHTVGYHITYAALVLAHTKAQELGLKLEIVTRSNRKWQQQLIERLGFKYIKLQDLRDGKVDLNEYEALFNGGIIVKAVLRQTYLGKTFEDIIATCDAEEDVKYGGAWSKTHYQFYRDLAKVSIKFKEAGKPIFNIIIDPIMCMETYDAENIYYANNSSMPNMTYVNIAKNYIDMFKLAYPNLEDYKHLYCKCKRVFGIFKNIIKSDIKYITNGKNTKRVEFTMQGANKFDHVQIDGEILTCPEYLAKQAQFSAAMLSYGNDSETISILRAYDALAVNTVPMFAMTYDDLLANTSKQLADAAKSYGLLIEDFNENSLHSETLHKDRVQHLIEACQI